jgi:tetraacyldisaccharide 4'-kinase
MSDVPNAFIRNLAVLDVDLSFERKDAIGRILDTAIERFKVRSI